MVTERPLEAMYMDAPLWAQYLARLCYCCHLHREGVDSKLSMLVHVRVMDLPLGCLLSPSLWRWVPKSAVSFWLFSEFSSKFIRDLLHTYAMHFGVKSEPTFNRMKNRNKDL